MPRHEPKDAQNVNGESNSHRTGHRRTFRKPYSDRSSRDARSRLDRSTNLTDNFQDTAFKTAETENSQIHSRMIEEKSSSGDQSAEFAQPILDKKSLLQEMRDSSDITAASKVSTTARLEKTGEDFENGLKHENRSDGRKTVITSDVNRNRAENGDIKMPSNNTQLSKANHGSHEAVESRDSDYLLDLNDIKPKYVDSNPPISLKERYNALKNPSKRSDAHSGYQGNFERGSRSDRKYPSFRDIRPKDTPGTDSTPQKSNLTDDVKNHTVEKAPGGLNDISYVSTSQFDQENSISLDWNRNNPSQNPSSELTAPIKPHTESFFNRDKVKSKTSYSKFGDAPARGSKWSDSKSSRSDLGDAIQNTSPISNQLTDSQNTDIGTKPDGTATDIVAVIPHNLDSSRTDKHRARSRRVNGRLYRNNYSSDKRRTYADDSKLRDSTNTQISTSNPLIDPIGGNDTGAAIPEENSWGSYKDDQEIDTTGPTPVNNSDSNIVIPVGQNPSSESVSDSTASQLKTELTPNNEDGRSNNAAIHKCATLPSGTPSTGAQQKVPSTNVTAYKNDYVFKTRPNIKTLAECQPMDPFGRPIVEDIDKKPGLKTIAECQPMDPFGRPIVEDIDKKPGLKTIAECQPMNPFGRPIVEDIDKKPALKTIAECQPMDPFGRPIVEDIDKKPALKTIAECQPMDPFGRPIVQDTDPNRNMTVIKESQPSGPLSPTIRNEPGSVNATATTGAYVPPHIRNKTNPANREQNIRGFSVQSRIGGRSGAPQYYNKPAFCADRFVHKIKTVTYPDVDMNNPLTIYLNQPYFDITKVLDHPERCIRYDLLNNLRQTIVCCKLSDTKNLTTLKSILKKSETRFARTKASDSLTVAVEQSLNVGKDEDHSTRSSEKSKNTTTNQRGLNNAVPTKNDPRAQRKYNQAELDALTEYIGILPFNPLLSFSDLKIPTTILQNLNPTPVQSFSIPTILHNSDILCRAPTGSGKTLAFLIPIVLIVENRLCSDCSGIQGFYGAFQDYCIKCGSPVRHKEYNFLKGLCAASQDPKNDTDSKIGPINPSNSQRPNPYGVRNNPSTNYGPYETQYNPFNPDTIATPKHLHDIKAIILTPTRELANQIAVHLTTLTKKPAAIITGGHGMQKQLVALRQATYVVATPGRLCDFLGTHTVDPLFLVLDEGDRMLDMGFSKELNFISSFCKRARKFLFSATFEDAVLRTAVSMLHEPVVVSVFSETVSRICQRFLLCKRKKVDILLDIIRNSNIEIDVNGNLVPQTISNDLNPADLKANLNSNDNPGTKIQRDPLKENHSNQKNDNSAQNENFARSKTQIAQNQCATTFTKIDFKKDLIIIFTETKATCKYLETIINNAATIHGDKDQQDRELALRQFTECKKNILIATSVAARGLDIPNVKLVINYDMPQCIKEYIHRIGRTGRCGKEGVALSFVDGECKIVKDVVTCLEEGGFPIPSFLRNFDNSNKSFSRGGGSSRGSRSDSRGLSGGYKDDRFHDRNNLSKGRNNYSNEGSVGSYGRRDSLTNSYGRKESRTNTYGRRGVQNPNYSSRISDYNHQPHKDDQTYPREQNTCQGIFSSSAHEQKQEDSSESDQSSSSE